MTYRPGDSFLVKYGGAAAAYSLRALNGNGENVVRVRRASDNSEQDFTALQVSSGEMVNWVNAQIVPPLDIRELDANGERTGALVEAAAAYSLRNLSASYTGNVVDVRRSSDDAEDSFTAAEVADGTLEAWVNGNWENVNYSTFTNGESWEDGFTAINTTSSSAGLKIPSGTTGDVITISFNLTLNSGTPSPSISLRQSAGGSIVSNVEFVYTAGSHSVTLTATGSYSHITIGEGDVPSGFSISNVILNVVPNPIFDGFVTQWYDQSGNDNHATQGTPASQPTIVEGGSLVSGGIDFDGVDDSLDVANDASLQIIGDMAQFVVINPDLLGASAGSSRAIVSKYSSDLSREFEVRNESSNIRYLDSNNSELFSGSIGIGNTSLISTLRDANTSVNVAEDGSLGTPAALSGTQASTTEPMLIGARSGISNWNGQIAELIIYPSDQSDNRTAIEANIGETYGIDLPSGVDTGYDEVDGFVETWYDQSGNGNDATQATITSQPKIVDGGSLVTGGLDFDGGDDVLTSGFNSSLTNYTFAGVYTVKTIQDNSGFLGKGAGSSDREFFVRIKSDGKVEHRVYSTGLSSTFDTIASSASAISVDTTALIAGSFNGSTNAIRLDIDDTVLTATSSVGLYAGTSSLTIPSSLGNAAHAAVAELVFYNTDQSGKLADIKTNINDHYNIYA